jgi:hypothetical protein
MHSPKDDYLSLKIKTLESKKSPIRIISTNKNNTSLTRKSNKNTLNTITSNTRTTPKSTIPLSNRNQKKIEIAKPKEKSAKLLPYKINYYSSKKKLKN